MEITQSKVIPIKVSVHKGYSSQPRLRIWGGPRLPCLRYRRCWRKITVPWPHPCNHPMVYLSSNIVTCNYDILRLGGWVQTFLCNGITYWLYNGYNYNQWWSGSLFWLPNHRHGMIANDEHIFQVGWNHQMQMYCQTVTLSWKLVGGPIRFSYPLISYVINW